MKVQKKNLVRKKFGSENFLGKFFFIVVLVLLVTWTLNLLNSAKSPHELSIQPSSTPPSDRFC